ncbi:MAG TPA: NDP-hexose 2,3-dehydratase family protein [Candidatus Dojkabacteria bacterium]|nr:NDP-hexose 2,3-dehydratase family protein [Candidatus Dojkabacteria bacterium]
MKSSILIKNWLKKIANESKLSVKRINFIDSNEWVFSNGKLHHKSGRFFSIIDVNWDKKDYLLIDQREIGTLGFLIFKGSRNNQIFVQAKVEPGNIGKAQLSPTCQATASNIARQHGGKLPPFASLFMKNDSKKISDSLQSEQGTRFFQKRNRNVIFEAQNKTKITSNHYKWLNVDDFLPLLGKDFLVNTDARSVIVSSNWKELVGRAPFSKVANEFTKNLLYSFETQDVLIPTNHVLKLLKAEANKLSKPKLIDLDKCKALSIKKDEIRLVDDATFRAIQISVSVNGREVSTWDQPIIDSFSSGRASLYYARKDNILYFLFKIQPEPGLYNLVELGPSFINEPGSKSNEEKELKGKITYKAWQSDEGGRFFKDKTLYSLVDIGTISRIKNDCIWLTLRQIQELSQKGGIFNNEARSAISLLLQWM